MDAVLLDTCVLLKSYLCDTLLSIAEEGVYRPLWSEHVLAELRRNLIVLERNGPAEGLPLVDSVTASPIANMKELRPPSSGRREIRILLVFDPWRAAILLVAGDKSGQWDKWYLTAIPRAEQLYDDYLAERTKEMGP
jgi:hypothetical protein